MAEEPQPEKLEKLHRLEELSNEDLKTVIDKGRHVRLPANWSLNRTARESSGPVFFSSYIRPVIPD